MGYFSNGSEGTDYEIRYCHKCIHCDDCAVLELHLLHNYDDCNNRDSYLHYLIPRTENGNAQCRMFIKKND